MTTGQPAFNQRRPTPSNLTLRVITALVGGPLVLALVYVNGWWFAVAAAGVAAVAILELYALGRDRDIQGYAGVGVPAVMILVALSAAGRPDLLPAVLLLAAAGAALAALRGRARNLKRRSRALVTLAGVFYIGLPSAFLVALRAQPEGLTWLVLVLAITWGTDTLAFVGGRLWGRHRLAPRISPKKTVEGAIIGALGGALLGALWLALNDRLLPELLPLLVIGPPAAIAGDLFESWIKRFFHAGESHLAGFNPIPGHGGVLDRIDSLIWVVTLGYSYFQLLGGIGRLGGV